MQETPDGRYSDFDRLMGRYAKLIRWLCWMYSGGNEMQTADLVQDVLMALWNRRETLRPGVSAMQEKAWVRLQCLSVLQHSRRRKRVETIPIEPDTIMDVADDSGSELEAQRERIYALAEGLTPHERMLLDMTLENYSVAEIAVAMGIKPKSVSQLKMRMLEKMKANKDKYYGRTGN